MLNGGRWGRRGPFVLAAAAAAAAGLGVLAWRRLARRYPSLPDRTVGADGIVPGAEPIHLPASGRRAALLLHGFGDTPQPLGHLAAHLHAHGWAVRAPLLPGHGRTLAAFSESGCDDWIRHAREEFAALRRQHAVVAVVGLSMGGALATILAGEADGKKMVALALVAPYLSMPRTVRGLARLHRVWAPVVPVVGSRGERSILDDVERARSLAYGIVTGRLLRELLTVVDRAAAAAPHVTVRTLVVHSRQDIRIPAAAAQRAFDRLGAAEKRLEWVDDGGHVLTVDHGRDRVQALVAEWLEGTRASDDRRAVGDA
ncbi:MAG TPA: alpha/beta fold hydrolase [Gemmatimonadaceae bacterium]|nr:alpha/beta fold hydrolase [Gemmatimonadaceae bacterium]